jgi:hypothetical protein
VNAHVHDSPARLFEQSLPYIESLLMRALCPLLHTSDDSVHTCTGGLDNIEIKPYPLKGNQLQVRTWYVV